MATSTACTATRRRASTHKTTTKIQKNWVSAGCGLVWFDSTGPFPTHDVILAWCLIGDIALTAARNL